MSVTYKYARPALTVDCVVFGLELDADPQLKVLLIRRGGRPFTGHWALPGGFVNIDETTDAAALRELEEETGVRDLYLEQLYTFSTPDRDPRERVVSVAHYALVKLSDHDVQAATDASDAQWFAVTEVPPLAFDHDEILRVALERLRGKIRYQPIGFELLPEKFTLTEIQSLYETILEAPLDKRNFRKKLRRMGLLEALDEWQERVQHRRAQLYRFDRERHDELVRTGFEFQL